MPTLSDYRDRPHWSYSSLNQLLAICTLQWRFQRLDKLPVSFRPLGLALGSAFHRVMEWTALSRMDNAVPSPAEAGDLFQDLWARECGEDLPIRFPEGLDSESCASCGANLCRAYVEGIDPAE